MDLTCLNDGAALNMVDLPGTPPWVCTQCSHGWWNSELTDAARAAWRPQYQDFGSSTASIAAAVVVEQAAAMGD